MVAYCLKIESLFAALDSAILFMSLLDLSGTYIVVSLASQKEPTLDLIKQGFLL